MTIIRMKDTQAEKERRGSVARENNVEREGGKEGKGGGDEKVEQGEKERTIIFFFHRDQRMEENQNAHHNCLRWRRGSVGSRSIKK